MDPVVSELEALQREIERVKLVASKDKTVLDAILRDSPYGIIVCDERGALTMTNPAAERIWAGSATDDSVADWGRDRAFHADGRPFIGEDWGMAACLRDRVPMREAERRIIKLDNTEGWLLASASPIIDGHGQLVGAVSIFADITAIKLAQTMLQRYADERALMARAADLFASSLDVDHVLRELARMVIPRLGDWCAIDMLEDGVVRRIVVEHGDPGKIELAAQLEKRYPSDPRSSSGLHAVIRTGKTQMLAKITPEMIDRGARDAEHLALLRELDLRSFVIAPIANRGEVFGALTVVTAEADRYLGDDDVRLIEELASRAAVSVANARLYHESQAKAAALEAERKALAASNAELDQFAYAASHDLRAPLRGIANLATWIEEDLGAAIPHAVQLNLTLLRGRVARMDNLINAILALSRVGRSKPKPESVALGELLHEIIDLLAVAPPAHVVADGELPTIVTDRAGLQQVLMNLIGNALKHADRPDVEVRVTCVRRGHELELAVADNGAGIPVEHHDRVWQMFQTLRPRDVAENTGIGLALVKKQVEANGGRAWIDPATTAGACFRFSWPITNRQPTDPTDPTDLTGPTGRST